MLHAILRHNEQTRIRPDSRREQVGPLALMTSASNKRPYVNYAWPVVEHEHTPVAHVTLDNLIEIVRRFHEANRLPRFEFPAELAPSLGLLLEEYGFTETRTMPLMAWRWPTNVVPPPGFEVSAVQTPEDLQVHTRVYHEGFQIEPPADLNTILESRYRDVVEGRRIFLTALLNGQPAATAQLIPGVGSVEIVGVTTLPALRGHGIGAALTQVATQQARERGANLIFLASASDQSSRLYRRIGYQEIGTTVTWVAKPDT